MVVKANPELYLNMIQKGLCCVQDGLKERGIKVGSKQLQGIDSHHQTCCNIVQSDLTGSGLRRHLKSCWGVYTYLLLIKSMPGSQGGFQTHAEV